jgi:hypothetical protein
VVVGGPATAPLEADLRDTPDLFPALAVVVASIGGRLTGLAGLAAKESDRLAVMTRHLTTLGFAVEAGAAWFASGSGARRRWPADHALDPAGDHRYGARGRGVCGAGRPDQEPWLRRKVLARVLGLVARDRAGGVVRIRTSSAGAVARLLAWDASFLPVVSDVRVTPDGVALGLGAPGVELARVCQWPRGQRAAVALQTGRRGFLFERGWYRRARCCERPGCCAARPGSGFA